MSYMRVLLVIFSLNTVTFTLPTQAGVLEIRSMPVVHNKPISSLWKKFVRKVKADIQSDGTPRTVKGLAYILIGSTVAISGIILLPEAAFPIAMGSIPARNLLREVRRLQKSNRKQLMKGEQVHFMHRHEGTETLCFGCIQDTPHLGDEKVIVKTAHQNHSKVSLDDIIGVAVPDHPDLHRRVSLVAEAEDRDYLRIIGKVSMVYTDGSYKIEIDSKVDFNNVEFPVDEPHTIFVHASLPKHKGGFVFSEGKSGEHHESIQLAEAARQVDFAHDNAELEQRVVIWDK